MTSRSGGETTGTWTLVVRIIQVAMMVLGLVLTGIAIPWIRWQTENAYRTDELLHRTHAIEAELKQNATDHADIKVSLARIEAKLGVLPAAGSK